MKCSLICILINHDVVTYFILYRISVIVILFPHRKVPEIKQKHCKKMFGDEWQEMEQERR